MSEWRVASSEWANDGGHKGGGAEEIFSSAPLHPRSPAPLRVLVTDCDKRKSLPIVRALGKEGVQVICGSSDALALSFFSKYCTRRVRYPPADGHNPGEFIAWLTSFVSREGIPVLIPLEEKTIVPVLENKAELSRYTQIPFPDLSIFAQAADKRLTLAIAERVGVPIPKTYVVQKLDHVPRIADEVDYPCVIKPRQSAGTRGLVYVRCKKEMDKYYEVHRVFPFPLIQEFIPNGGAYGVSVLLDRGANPIAVFTHKRLREFPVSGGPSTLCESVRYPEIEALALRLLKELGWCGVAQVEFRVDARDGVPRLMEINPRFWGSVALPIYAGTNFPYLLCKVALSQDIQSVQDYQEGLRCRWLLPGDILHFVKNPRRFKLNPSFFRFVDGKTCYYVLSRDDPLPTLGFLACSVRDLLSGQALKDMFSRG